MKEAIFSILRHALTAAGAAAVAAGYADQDSVIAIVGGLIAAVSVGYEYAVTRKLADK
jgi:hypothetical protein